MNKDYHNIQTRRRGRFVQGPMTLHSPCFILNGTRGICKHATAIQQMEFKRTN